MTSKDLKPTSQSVSVMEAKKKEEWIKAMLALKDQVLEDADARVKELKDRGGSV